jgi:uncharacterized membrane protein
MFRTSQFAIRVSSLVATTGIVLLWIGVLGNNVVSLMVTTAVLVLTGLVTSWAIFPTGISSLERGALTAVLAFLVPGGLGVALGLLPIGITMNSAASFSVAVLVMIWIIAEMQSVQRLRSDENPTNGSDAPPRSADDPSDHSIGLIAVAALVTLLGIVMYLWKRVRTKSFQGVSNPGND